MTTASRSLATALQGRARSRLAPPSYTTSWDVTTQGSARPLFVPARTPPEIVRKISVDTIAALADPVVKSKLEQAGYMVVGSSPHELQTLLKSEIDKWSAVIKTVGIKIN